jgi:hypothetical protein
MRTIIVVGLLAALALVGCDQKTWFEKFIPKEEEEFSKNYIAFFQAHDFEHIEAKIDPSLKNAQLRSNLEQIAAFFPAEKPIDIQTVGAQSFSNADMSQVNLTFQYKYPGKWLLVNVVLKKRGGDTVVMGVNVQPLRDSLESINRFTFEGKDGVQYIVLAATVIVPLFILYALVLCARTSIPKRKWLWILFILVGFAQVTLNWSDGNVHINPLRVQLFGAGFWKAGPFAPWLLSVSLPIGAIVFLLRRKKWVESKE